MVLPLPCHLPAHAFTPDMTAQATPVSTPQNVVRHPRAAAASSGHVGQ